MILHLVPLQLLGGIFRGSSSLAAAALSTLVGGGRLEVGNRAGVSAAARRVQRAKVGTSAVRLHAQRLTAGRVLGGMIKGRRVIRVKQQIRLWKQIAGAWLVHAEVLALLRQTLLQLHLALYRRCFPLHLLLQQLSIQPWVQRCFHHVALVGVLLERLQRVIHKVLFRVRLIDLPAGHLDALALVDDLQHALNVLRIVRVSRVQRLDVQRVRGRWHVSPRRVGRHFALRFPGLLQSRVPVQQAVANLARHLDTLGGLLDGGFLAVGATRPASYQELRRVIYTSGLFTRNRNRGHGVC